MSVPLTTGSLPLVVDITSLKNSEILVTHHHHHLQFSGSQAPVYRPEYICTDRNVCATVNRIAPTINGGAPGTIDCGAGFQPAFGYSLCRLEACTMGVLPLDIVDKHWLSVPPGLEFLASPPEMAD